MFQFTLPVLTFIWLLTGEPVKSIKTTPHQPKVTTKVKAQNITKETTTSTPKAPSVVSEQPVQPKTHTNMLNVNGSLIPVGSLQAHDLFVESADQLQNYIDLGYVGTAWHELDNHDGLVTYMAGHNPGVFSPLANYAQIGRTFQVWDKHGNVRTYQFVDMYESSLYDLEEDQVDGKIVNYMYNHMNDHEGILLQWCREERGVIQMWVANPID